MLYRHSIDDDKVANLAEIGQIIARCCILATEFQTRKATHSVFRAADLGREEQDGVDGREAWDIGECVDRHVVGCQDSGMNSRALAPMLAGKMHTIIRCLRRHALNTAVHASLG